MPLIQDQAQSPPASPVFPSSSSSSASSSPSLNGTKRRHCPSLSLDLSDLPALTTPSPPSNTLIITNLLDPIIFQASNLQSIRDAISGQAELFSFSPLKSFKRIIATFITEADSIKIKTLLDGENVLGQRIRVYFGESIDVQEKINHLSAPKSNKLFFISPPPSPPMGWTMKNEDPPNKLVHADDLASALEKVRASKKEELRRREASIAVHHQQQQHHQPQQQQDNEEEESKTKSNKAGLDPTTSEQHRNVIAGGRSRSSTLVFDPEENGIESGLPCIAVEDTSEDEWDSPVEGEDKRVLAHTARPPVELMH